MNPTILALLERQTGTPCCVPATANQVHRVEQRLGRPMPLPFKKWVTTCNGSLGGEGGILGLEQPSGGVDLEEAIALYPELMDRGFFPVAMDGCGNHYVLVEDQNVPEHFPVCFIDNALEIGSLAYTVASRMDLFLEFMISRELQLLDEWPFDREWMVQHDPDIVKVVVAPLPWNCD